MNPMRLPVRFSALTSVTREMNSESPQRAQAGTTMEAFDSILDAARAGADWAWSRLVGDLDPVVSAYVRRLGADDAENVVGETWLHVARGIHRFRGGVSDFRSWVFMIAHHRVIDERRRKTRKPTRLEDGAELDRLAPSSTSAESLAMEQVEMDQVVEVLNHLTADQREVVLLRVMGGFGIKEIGEIMGKRPGAVQSLQHRAFKNLEKILGKAVRLETSPSVTRVT